MTSFLFSSSGPGAAPGNFTVDYNPARPTVINLRWRSLPTEHHNGVIRGYVVTALPVQGPGEPLHLNITPPSLESFQLSDLTPNTLYNISIAAFTAVGRGPMSSAQIRLLPRGKLRGNYLKLKVLNALVLWLICWNHSTSFIFLPSFTVPNVAPTLGEITRISATEIQISWGEVEGDSEVDTYFVKYRPLQSVRRKRNVEDTSVVVETSQTRYRLMGLDPGFSYAVSVAAGNRAGRGNFSMEVTVPCESKYDLMITGHTRHLDLYCFPLQCLIAVISFCTCQEP